jgi:hypothetical protein
VAVAKGVIDFLSAGLNRLNEIGLWQWGEGSWRLRPLEVVVIRQAITIMPTYLQPKAEAQLLQKMFVERSNPRINMICPYRHDLELNLDGEWHDALVKVSLEVDGQKQNANVTTIKGRLFSVEFKKPAKFYKGKTIVVGEAKLGNPRQGYTRAIDRAEHGRSENE